MTHLLMRLVIHLDHIACSGAYNDVRIQGADSKAASHRWLATFVHRLQVDGRFAALLAQLALFHTPSLKDAISACIAAPVMICWNEAAGVAP